MDVLGSPGAWVGSWSTSPQPTESGNLPPAPGLAGNTLRQVVLPSLGGSRLRLRLSNVFGNGPVTLRAVHLAQSSSPLTAAGSGIDPATDRALTFDGRPFVSILAGEARTSDPLDYPLRALEKLAISIAFDEVPGELTSHPGSRTTSYLARGHVASASNLPEASAIEHWYYISGIDVLSDGPAAAVVTLGDSITDGRGSTTDANNRWPDLLARRLRANPRTAHVAVLNQGIGGNAVLAGGLGPTALERFERDVLGQSGVRWLVILEGVNDIGMSHDPELANELIGAYQRLIRAARARGILVYGVPILPIQGSHYDSPVREAMRQQVNEWMRSSGAFDAVIDLEQRLTDPAHRARLLPSFDSGDQLHPSAMGHEAMAEAVDLGLFSR